MSKISPKHRNRAQHYMRYIMLSTTLSHLQFRPYSNTQNTLHFKDIC